MMKVTTILLCAVACVLLAGTSAVAFDDWGTEVFPTATNTVSTQSPYYTNVDEIDNLWWNYWDFHGTPWVSCSDQGENSPLLTTTVTGLDVDKVYDVYVYFFDRTLSDALPGVLMAGQHGQPLIRCDRDNSQWEIVYDPGVERYRKLLGQVAYVSSFSVDVDDVTDGSGRAMYGGIEYKEGVLAGATLRPTLNPDGGMLSGPSPVTISCDTPGATIRYTLDGTTPLEDHGTVIASGDSVTVSPGQTLKVQAWATGLLPSGVKTATYGLWGTEVLPNPGNTTSLISPYYAGPDSPGNDNLWEYYWAYHGQVWVSCSDSKYMENAPLITTTVTGLDPGRTYNVYACFFDRTRSDSLPGVIMAALQGETLIRCDRTNSEFEIAYPEKIDRYRKLLGQVSGVTSFAVDIDDVTDGSGRAYYLAIEYMEPVPPGNLVGTITLENLSSNANMALLPIRVQFVESGVVKSTRTVTLTENGGEFSLLGISPGDYTVEFKASKWLTKGYPVTITTLVDTNVDAVLVNGDVDSDNSITSSDLSVILTNVDTLGN